MIRQLNMFNMNFSLLSYFIETNLIVDNIDISNIYKIYIYFKSNWIIQFRILAMADYDLNIKNQKNEIEFFLKKYSKINMQREIC